MVCKKCGHKVNEGDLFCMTCGSSLKEQQTLESKPNIPKQEENKQEKNIYIKKKANVSKKKIIIGIELIIIIVIAIISFIIFNSNNSNYKIYNEIINKWVCNNGETYLDLKDNGEYEWFMDDKEYYYIKGTYTVKKQNNIYNIKIESKNRIVYGREYTNEYKAEYNLTIKNTNEIELKNVNINQTYRCNKES